MEPTSSPLEKSRKQLVAEKFNAAVGDIKNELIRRGYEKEEDLKSQVAVLMSVAEVLNGVDLKSKYPVRPRRKCEGRKTLKEMDKERFQIRKNKKNDAFDSLREFITRERLVYGSPKRLEQLEVVEVILKYIKPDSVDDTVDGAQISPSTSPGLPTLVPTPTLTIQDPVQPSVLSPTPGLLPTGAGFNFPPAPLLNFPRTVNQFQMMMQKNHKNLQLQLQYQQAFRTIRNLHNANQVTPNEA
ncbi:hypothetical protein GCK72_010938 [Caenorhabditis remanei]|uniref:Uncharacterized protein n=1 Tax=Caenorhabditis remanei TaxID=31234 RepID=A0A6A5H737_CAERE|nr:hypothetical protein GCK72_010938 [Caenorhabditis remanei]KAF1762676.1 hypothetical protein GCK72_010938 [Caenorhabditis remanei]